jgi:hypothetical protein
MPGPPLNRCSAKGTLPNSISSNSALLLLASNGGGVAHSHSPPTFSYQLCSFNHHPYHFLQKYILSSLSYNLN